MRQIHDFYHLTIDGLQAIIHRHEMMVWGDERIKQLTAELEASGGKASRTKGKKAKIDKSRKDAKERATLRSEKFPVASPFCTASRSFSFGGPSRQWSKTLWPLG